MLENNSILRQIYKISIKSYKSNYSYGELKMTFVYWDSSINSIFLLNLAIIIILFTLLRLFSGTIAHVNATKEILKKNNPAFGVSVGSLTFAIAIMLSGAIYGYPDGDVLISGAYVAGYGALGILLMTITRYIFDKLTLPDISLRDEITKGNIAVAIADASNVLATAIIIRSLMIWVTDNAFHDFLSLIFGFVIAQIILTSTTYLRRRSFRFLHVGFRTQQQLQSGNVAFALSFGARKIATAFAITIASNFDFFEVYDFKMIFLPWIIIAISAVITLKVIAVITEKIVLFRIPVMKEILDDRNIAIAAIHAAIYISLGLLISGL